MNTYIIGIVVLIALVLIFIVKVRGNITMNVIALDEAEVALDSILRKKFDLLNKTVGMIKNILGTKEPIIDKIVNLRSKKLDNLKLNEELIIIGDELYKLVEEKRRLKNNNDFFKLLTSINDVEIQLRATSDYYNSKITIHNNLVRKFPSNIVAFRFKEKQYFNFDTKKQS